MTIERIPIDSIDEWLAARPAFVNASEMATVCGEAGYGSLAELYAEKKGLRPPQADSRLLRRGRWIEPAVFQALTETYPEWQVQRARIHCIDRERRIAATPDGFAQAPDRSGWGVIEAKVVARGIYRAKWLDDPDGPIDGPAMVPTNFRIQVATTRMLNADKCPWAVVAVLIISEYDSHFQLFDVDVDPVLEDRILFNADAFLKNYLDANIMPPFDPQRDEQLVKLLYPKDNGTEVDLTGDNRALVATEEFVEVGDAISRLKKTHDALKTELTSKIGEHTFARLADGRRLSWKQQHRKSHVVAESDFRVLRVMRASESKA